MDDFEYVLTIIDPWINKYYEHGAAALLPDELVGVGVWLLEAEVNNGGFGQYYFNSAGELAIQTVPALRAIGAERTARLLEEANSEFPKAMPPVDRTMRQEKLDEISECTRFYVLEKEFYEAPEDLTALLAVYLRRLRTNGS
ncbi:DMP19 family protein [Massilia sp. PAMC28688]|uniref:DMP19 family protein n=1 Tax=Massilia sp. PAMC28688 TaxID=2861283 RepID=UPI001C625793|nr:DMP19 family protein [Massilia sp. PAMC28688]QYF95239.1 DMP19 family protein [Massilia sp. PAMC28688]